MTVDHVEGTECVCADCIEDRRMLLAELRADIEADWIEDRRRLLEELRGDIEIAGRLRTGIDVQALADTCEQLEREIAEGERQ